MANVVDFFFWCWSKAYDTFMIFLDQPSILGRSSEIGFCQSSVCVCVCVSTIFQMPTPPRLLLRSFTRRCPRWSSIWLVLFLAIHQFGEFWRIFCRNLAHIFKSLPLPEFCTDLHQILPEGVPGGPPPGLCFLGRFVNFSNFGDFFRFLP